MKNEIKPAGYTLNSHIFAVVATLLSCFTVFGQRIVIDIQWDEPVAQLLNDESVLVPVIRNNDFENGLPFFSFQQPVKNGKFNLKFSEVVTVPAPVVDIQFINRSGRAVPSVAEISLDVRSARNESFLVIGAFPYVLVNGSVQRITRFTVDASYAGPETAIKDKSYAANSVLAEGSWYKLSVPKDGVYKIDKAFLKSCGIDLETLNPKWINIYGNASGRLSELNSAAFYDDLAKNAIRVEGEADNVFDDGDYILFYGAGPNRWDYSPATGFSRDQHIYSEVNTYFIHISETDAPLRISAVSEAAGPVTKSITSYDYIEQYEQETYNLVKGGQRWYGNLFDGILEQPLPFSVADLVSSVPVQVKYVLASNATTSGNNFQFSYNGSVLHTKAASTGGGEYARDPGSFQFSPGGAISGSFLLAFNRINPAVQGYLDFVQITAERVLKAGSAPFQFRSTKSIGAGDVSEFSIANMTGSSTVWEVTDKRTPGLINGILSGNQYMFRLNTDVLREFIVFNETGLLTPDFVEAVPNQDLHSLPQADYIIVTHPSFLTQAQRLANLHVQQGTSTHVVTTTQVFNEYSSGVVDATSIRRFVKMFYERAGTDVSLQPKYLLLFGDATYDPKDRIANNNYKVPTYEMLYSEDHINAMVTDDYFGLLDNNESINGPDLMDIGVGRLLISNEQQAKEQVDKIEHYMHNGSGLYTEVSGSTNSTFGDWRLNYSLITDDEEGGYFINKDAEPAVSDVQSLYPEMNYDKIYCDAYVQTSTAGGQRYPEVFDAITDRIQRGSLVINYIGHGGEVGAAEERIITIPQIQSWTNIDKLTLFVSATCEFARFDDPARISAGEWVSLNPMGGGIALMTTTRSVYFGVNSATILRFYENVFRRNADHTPLTFGEIIRLTKNQSGSSDNRRSFTLIGDPALKIALPMWKVVTDSINHVNPLLVKDTVRALSKMNVKGHLEDFSGNVLTTFNGVVSPTIYDKERLNHTLANDPTSPQINFKTRTNALYKGKASVANGYFSFDCIVPKDINYDFGRGKISYYADAVELNTDGDGFDTNFYVGGVNANAVADNQGPSIDLYLNDNKFVNGGITSPEPVLIIDCFDENGINTVGNGVGHDLAAILDGKTAEPVILNNYYSGKLDSYQAGQIQYTFRKLPVGPHTLDVKIWDSNNNSSTARIEFTVVEDKEVELAHVLNYPNPFTTKTTFFFEHNQPGASLETQVQIYTVSGRLIKTINQLVETSGFRSEGIDWDGTDDYGDQLAKGVYVYRLSVELRDGGKAEKLEKLVLLR